MNFYKKYETNLNLSERERVSSIKYNHFSKFVPIYLYIFLKQNKILSIETVDILISQFIRSDVYIYFLNRVLSTINNYLIYNSDNLSFYFFFGLHSLYFEFITYRYFYFFLLRKKNDKG